MTDNVTYSIIKSSAARQALKDDRQQQEGELTDQVWKTVHSHRRLGE